MIIKIHFLLKYMYYFILRNKLFSTFNNYRFTDEKLKYIHLLEAINYSKISLQRPIYYEFGCHSGRTFSSAINAFKFLKINDYHAYAFDSFKGLPNTQKEDGFFKVGTFCTSYIDFIKILKKKTYYDSKNITIFPGYYDISLNKINQVDLFPPTIIHIDVDLYSSCKTVLNFIKPLLKSGVVILFDDYYCFPPAPLAGERKAFEEFLNENQNIKAESWKTYSTFGKSFLITIS